MGGDEKNSPSETKNRGGRKPVPPPRWGATVPIHPPTDFRVGGEKLDSPPGGFQGGGRKIRFTPRRFSGWGAKNSIRPPRWGATPLIPPPVDYEVGGENSISPPTPRKSGGRISPPYQDGLGGEKSDSPPYTEVFAPLHGGRTLFRGAKW